MTTIQIELPEATVQAAREAGLLTTEALERLLNEASAASRPPMRCCRSPTAWPRPAFRRCRWKRSMRR